MQYTAVKTADGDVKILSAPEESDGDVVTKRYLVYLCLDGCQEYCRITNLS